MDKLRVGDQREEGLSSKPASRDLCWCPCKLELISRRPLALVAAPTLDKAGDDLTLQKDDVVQLPGCVSSRPRPPTAALMMASWNRHWKRKGHGGNKNNEERRFCPRPGGPDIRWWRTWLAPWRSRSDALYNNTSNRLAVQSVAAPTSTTVARCPPPPSQGGCRFDAHQARAVPLCLGQHFPSNPFGSQSIYPEKKKKKKKNTSPTYSSSSDIRFKQVPIRSKLYQSHLNVPHASFSFR
ncbi:hypothetical protein OPV22_025132 [Ensete ventricosum]|uniref:Uncharacterized protein n=1 Tax=Ensete ventricosum TaxID=4639 RepID=A0AAV8Q2Z9_ENSVE|nr:hypothetical protein OPV22_025132 [Ensete ventricosum]